MYLAEGEDKAGKREKKIKLAGAFFFACCEALGYMAIFSWGFHGNFLQWLCLAAAGIMIWEFVFYYVLTDVLMLLDWQTNRGTVGGKQLSGKATILMFAVMVGVRFLFWLNWFPGLLSKDTFGQIQQAIGNVPYSNHHSWLHTMLIRAFLTGGVYQHRIALMSLTDLVFSSVLLLWILHHYYERTSIRMWLPAAVVYTLGPLHCIFSVSIRKDPFFAYAVLGYTLVLLLMEEQSRKEGKPRWYMWPVYIVATFLFCFLRTNGLYAWVLALPFLLWHFRKQLKGWLISVGICLLLIVTYKSVILPGFHVIEPDIVESLSVPLQQIAYTIQKDGEFSEYDKEIIGNIVDMELMGEYYTEWMSDPVKNIIRGSGHQEYIGENKGEFIKMYLSVGMKNPVEYMTAFLFQSRGYWHQKSTDFLYYENGVYSGASELGIVRAPLLPAGISGKIDSLMELYEDAWNTFWSLALNTYVVVVLWIYAMIKRKCCFHFIPLAGIFVTLIIATPVGNMFRYVYGIYLVLPLLALQTGVEGMKAETD